MTHTAARVAQAPSGLVRLGTGAPWIDPRHRAGWRRAWRDVSAAAPPRDDDDPRGVRELRVALAERIARTRGFVVDPDEVLVTAGTVAGLRHVLSVLPPGPVGVEDPGFRAAVAAVEEGGRRVVDLPVGEPPPAHLVDDVTRHRETTHDTASWPVQRALLTLLRDGWLDKAVRTARRVYADRAPRVAAVLAPHGEPTAPTAGTYSTWLMPQDRALVARDAARRAGFDLPLLSEHCRTARYTGVVLGFGGVSDQELDRALAAIRRGLDG